MGMFIIKIRNIWAAGSPVIRSIDPMVTPESQNSACTRGQWPRECENPSSSKISQIKVVL
jgi:hypothetical protein